ncbi:hypothetical protein [Paenibacillus sp. FSL R7-0337]|uniref:hypothetical protein n=1 Tax=Paenibacillus sp. FSL R7-0337 TaxID=1926588 RepID=UPI00096F6C75|nr:hypothetical protein [Paenibacillus sp. FSL R7-0337]OMF98537.1 hypothetical protein BK147_09930 [Paenibacillus sp. FSL R7-0337]
MQTVQASELEQSRQDFGENRIQPKPDKSILRSAHKIRAVAPPAFQLKPTGSIPPDVAGYLNPQLAAQLQVLPFADKLINKIAASSPVQGLLQPLQGPVDKVGGLIGEATQGATGLVDEAQSQTNQVFGNGTKLLANLSGINGAAGKDNSGKDSSGKKEEPKAGGKAGAAKNETTGDFLGTVKGGVHTRLLAFGKKLLKSGVNLVSAGAGKLKNAITGLLVNFKIGKESHELWVEKRGSGHVVMMASKYPQSLPVIIKGFKGRIEKLKQDKNGNPENKKDDSGVNVEDLINPLKASEKKFGATPVDDLKKADLETIVPLIRALELYLEKREGAAGGKEEVGTPPRYGDRKISQELYKKT